MSTNVLWAGTVSGRKIVSIFNNPAGQAGSNVPLNNPQANLNRIYFDTRFNYLSVITKANFVQSYPLRELNTDPNNSKGKDAADYPLQGTSIYALTRHNLGYAPAAILIDYDTREIIGSNMFVQNLDNNSFRTATLMMDTTNVYLQERFFVRRQTLPALTRRYTLLVFENAATVTLV
jgi:hypothetical protein